MFDKYPTYSRYRNLQLASPYQAGEDVYALQTALSELKFAVGDIDGQLGPKTSAAIKAAQKSLFLVVDGQAGGTTQKALALQLADVVSRTMKIPYDCFRGQLDLESAYRLGNYSPMRPDGSYDAGLTQRNTEFTPPAKGFDCQDSIVALGAVINKHYALFADVKTGATRRWALAQGAWNAPAYACYLAREEGATKVTASMTLKPSTAARKAFEAYVANASTYL